MLYNCLAPIFFILNAFLYNFNYTVYVPLQQKKSTIYNMSYDVFWVHCLCRSYYRCTQDNCRVKKRVERLAEDPRMVITTYEGRHAHSPSNELEESQTQSELTNFFW